LDTRETYSIILAKQDGLQDRTRIMQVFREYTRINPDISEVAAKHSAGFIAEKISREEVFAVGKICMNNNVEIFIVTDASTAVLPKADNCRYISCLSEEFGYSLDGTAKNIIEWSDVAVVCAGIIEEEKVTTTKHKEGPSAAQKLGSMAITMTTGLPIPLGRAKEVTKKVMETIVTNYLELIIYPPAPGQTPLRLKMNQDNIDYSYLAARREYSSPGNFRLVLEDIDKYAVKALRNHVFYSIIKKEPASLSRYEDYRYLEKELRWLMTLRQMKNKE